MGILYSTYYGLTRISEVGPEAKGWSTTDDNFEIIGLALRTHELHQHGGATPIKYPGYNFATPATPTTATLTEVTSGGSLPPGSTIGVRISYLTSMGLETEGSPETTVQLSPVVGRPSGPIIGPLLATPVQGLVPGGTYLYALTKRKGTSETDISSVTSAPVPFDSVNTYSVPLTFDPGNLYTDGTDSLRLYRSTGYDSAFSLVKTITDLTATSFTDTNQLESTQIQPPSVNQFNQFEKVNINWSSISHPANAYTLRVYVTREPSLWSTNHLLAELAMQDPSTPLPNNLDYLGSEILAKGWPKEISQIPSNPLKINLNTDAYGAPILTTNMDFQGWQSWNFVLANNINNATPIDGALYYDKSIPAFRARVAGNWLNLATPSAGSAVPYVHPVQEQGGHSTTNISYPALGGTTARAVLDIISTPVGSPSGGVVRKQVQKVTKVNPTANTYQYTSSAATPIPELDITVTPSFSGQWVETMFSGAFIVDPLGAPTGVTASFQLEVDNTLSGGAETVKSYTVLATPSHVPISISYATPIGIWGCRFRAFWWITTGQLTSIGPRRTLYTKEIL